MLPANLPCVHLESFESFSGVGILEVASLSLDEPEMEVISFEEQVEDVNAEEGEDIALFADDCYFILFYFYFILHIAVSLFLEK